VERISRMALSPSHSDIAALRRALNADLPEFLERTTDDVRNILKEGSGFLLEHVTLPRHVRQEMIIGIEEGILDELVVYGRTNGSVAPRTLIRERTRKERRKLGHPLLKKRWKICTFVPKRYIFESAPYRLLNGEIDADEFLREAQADAAKSGDASARETVTA